MSQKPERIKLGNGIYLNIIKTNKFKTNVLNYYFIRPLSAKEVTLNALTPLVLKRGSENYPNTVELDKKFEELYGAGIGLSSSKKGEKHVLRYSIQWPREEFLKVEGLDKQVVDILRELIYNPLVQNGGFNENYVNQEKINLENIIKSRINNKRSFAINRCIESMCRNERFGINQLGRIDDLKDINAKNLYRHHQEVLETSQIEIFFIGSIDDDLIEYIKKINSVERDNIIEIPDNVIVGDVQTKNMVKDHLNVNQGKLVIGYRSRIRHEDIRRYNALLIANQIFGGNPNSKLFQNVREKESLAYYISSSINKYKSIILVDAGIDFQDFDKTLDLVRINLSDVKDGKFDDDDIAISKKTIKSSMEGIKDSSHGMSEFFFNQVVSNDYRSLEERMEDIDRVTRDEIIEAANTIVVDTIYFMSNDSN